MGTSPGNPSSMKDVWLDYPDCVRSVVNLTYSSAFNLIGICALVKMMLLTKIFYLLAQLQIQTGITC